MPAHVLDAHRPTLSELTAHWPRWLRRALAALAIGLVLVAAVTLLIPNDAGRPYVHRGEPTFNLLASAGFTIVAPHDDEIVRFEADRDGTFLQSFAVAPLALPPYRGEVGAALPALAEAEIARLRGQYAQVRIAQEGKTRVNLLPAYSISFAARLGKRRLYGRDVLVPQDAPRGRAGVRLLMLATPASGVGVATDVGIRGGTKKPYRSFRFGTERP